MTQGVKHSFVGHLGHGGVSMNGMCDVFQDSTHLKSKRPFSNQLTDMSSHALDSQDAMVVFTGNNADETC